jgi:ABC-type lipoprotein release transport system permease subunit
VTVLARLALRNLWRNKRRTALTVAASVFAVFLTMVAESLAAGSHKRWIEEVVRRYPGHVEVMARGYRDHRTLDYGFEITPERARGLEGLAGAEGWAPRVESWALAMPDQEGAFGRAAWLLGVDPSRESSVSRLGAAVEGELLDGEGGPEVILGARLARSMRVGAGDTVILLSTDAFGSQAADRFRVSGTLEVGAPEFDSALVLLRLDRIREFLEYGEKVSHVAVLARSADAAEALAAELAGLFEAADYEVLAWPELLPDLAQLIEFDDVQNRLTLGILILVAAFGVLNTVLMSVFERVREFGVLRALGARRRMLFGVVLLEAALLGALGVAVALAAAVPLVLWLEGHPIPLGGSFGEMMQLFDLEPVIVFDLERKNLFGTPLVMLGVAILASLPAALRASRGHPVDAIRTVAT